MPKPVVYLNFMTHPAGMVALNYIPNGFSAADFGIIRGNGRMGVDQLFAGGNSKFEFSRMAQPEVFDLLQYILKTQGNEAQIQMCIDHNADGQILIIGDLELSTSDNNVFSLFTCDVMLGEGQTKIKKNIEANTDLFSDLDIDGNHIVPVQTEEVLLLSKPVFSTSVWESPDNAETITTGSSTESFNKIKNLTVDGIDGDLIWLEDSVNSPEERNKFKVLRAQTELTDVKVVIEKDLTVERISGNSAPSGIIFKGRSETFQQDLSATAAAGIPYEFYDYGFSNPSDINYDGSTFETNIGTMQPGDEIFFLFQGYTGVSKIKYGKTKLTITASAVNYDTVNTGIRLIEAIRYVAKSAGLTVVSFPEAEQGGWLYDQFLFNGNLLRNITDKPFYMTFKEITEWFPELHLDYEIQADGSIFVGTDKDFYANREIFRTKKIVFVVFKRNFNEEFLINLVDAAYDGYQSQKENDTANTYDVVHGELQDKSPNKNSKDTLDIKIGFIRDPFALENVRVKAFQKDENSATQDDDKKYIVDVYPSRLISYQTITNTKRDFLQHSFNDDTQLLTLRNTGNFNWSLLGIKTGYNFRITSSPVLQFNQGSWTVVEVSSRYIILSPVGPNTHSSENNGERYTNFQYFIPVNSLAGITWTNQDFSLITGVKDPEKYGNLRLSLTRNIITRWSSHLATAILGRQSGNAYKNLKYKNNPELRTSIYGLTIKEGDSFVPTNPILDQWLYTVAFQCTFPEYYQIMQDIRSNRRGYITTYDIDGNPLKLYVKDMRFKANAGTLGNVTLIGKGKYQPSVINIDTNQPDYIDINNGEYQVQRIIYEFRNNYFYIKDQHGYQMYGKLALNQITFNGQSPNSESQLINWLNQLI